MRLGEGAHDLHPHLFAAAERPCGRSRLSRMRNRPTITKRRAMPAALRTGMCPCSRVPSSNAQKHEAAERHAPGSLRSRRAPSIGIAEEGEGRIEHAWIEVGDVERDKEARDRRQRRGDGERLQLVGEHVLAERGSRVLVLADAAQHAAPGRVCNAIIGQDEDARKVEPDHDEQRQLRVFAQAAEAEPSTAASRRRCATP